MYQGVFCSIFTKPILSSLEIQKIFDVYTQCVSKFAEVMDRNILLTTLDHTHISAMYFGLLTKLFLGNTHLFALCTDSFAQKYKKLFV